MDEERLVVVAQVRRLLQTGEAGAMVRRCGVRPADVAAALKLPPATVGAWFRGTRTPRPEAALRLAGILELLAKSDHQVAS